MKSFAKQSVLSSALIGALAATSGVASADVSVYGRAHISFDNLDNGVDSANNLSSNSSRLGFRASTEVLDNLTAMAQIEQQVNFDTNGTTFATRDTFAGVEGDFGMLRAGKFDTPLKRVRSAVDLFGDQVGDARNIVRSRVGAPGASSLDERYPNSIHYQSPRLGPVELNLQYSTNTTGSSADLDDDEDGVSASAIFRQNDLYLVLAHETKGDEVGDRSASRLGAYYDLAALRLTGFYQTVSEDADGVEDNDAYGVGARYRVGKNDLKAQYYAFSSDADDADASMIAVGVDHHVSSDLRFYAVYGLTSNDDNAAFVPYREARSAGTTRIAGEDASAVSIGMRYDF